MHDPDTFDARLTDAFERLADRAPVDVDAVATARAASHAPVRSRMRRIWDTQPTWARVAVVLLALGLLLAMLGSTALIGSQLRDPLAVDEPPMVKPSALVAPTALAEAPPSPEPSALAEATPIDGQIVELASIEAALGSFTWETFAGPLPQPNPAPIRGNSRVGYVYGGDGRGVFFSEDGLHWQNVTEDTPDAVPPDMLGDCEIEATHGQWIACDRFSGPTGPQQLVILGRGPRGWAFEPVYLDRANVDDDGYLVDDILPVQSGAFSLIASGASDGDALIREAGGSFESINLDDPLESLLAAPDGGFVAFPDGVTGARTVTSADGRMWVDRGPPGYLADLPASARVARQPDRLVALTQGRDGAYTVWASSDGVAWTRQTPPVQYPLPIVEDSPPQEAIYGFHRNTVEITDLGLLWNGQYLSIDDGRSWARIPEAPDPSDALDCGGGVDIIGWSADSWYRLGGNGCGRDMSIGRFVASSPALVEPSASDEALPIDGQIVELASIEAVLGSFTWETFAGPLPRPNLEPIRGSSRVGYVYGGDDRGVFYSRDGLHWLNVTEAMPDAVLPDVNECDIEGIQGQWIACQGGWEYGGQQPRPKQLLILARAASGWTPVPVDLDPALVDNDDDPGYIHAVAVLPVQSGDVSIIATGASDPLVQTAAGAFEHVHLDHPLTSLLAVPDGGFVAFPNSVMGERTVTSADGRTWVDRGRPGYLADLPASARLARQGDRLVALTQGRDGTHTVWASSDGVAWTRQTPPIHYPSPIGEDPEHQTGWLHTIEITDLGLLWDGDYLSIDDGRSWARIPDAPDDSDDPGCGGGVGIGSWSADSWSRHGGNECGREMMVGRFGVRSSTPSPG